MRLSGRATLSCDPRVIMLVDFVIKHPQTFAEIASIITHDLPVTTETINDLVEPSNPHRKPLVELLERFFQGEDVNQQRGDFLECIVFKFGPFFMRSGTRPRIQRFLKVRVLDPRNGSKAVCDLRKSCDVGFERLAQFPVWELWECKVDLSTFVTRASRAPAKIRFMECVLSELRKHGYAIVGFVSLRPTDRSPSSDLNHIGLEELQGIVQSTA